MERVQTILVTQQWLVDDVVVIDIRVDLVVLHFHLGFIEHWDELVVVVRWARRPVLAEVREHIDMVTQEIEHRSPQVENQRPLSLVAPLQGGRQLVSNLRYCSDK